MLARHARAAWLDQAPEGGTTGTPGRGARGSAGSQEPRPGWVVPCLAHGAAARPVPPANALSAGVGSGVAQQLILQRPLENLPGWVAGKRLVEEPDVRWHLEAGQPHRDVITELLHGDATAGRQVHHRPHLLTQDRMRNPDHSR